MIELTRKSGKRVMVALSAITLVSETALRKAVIKTNIQEEQEGIVANVLVFAEESFDEIREQIQKERGDK